VLKIRNELDNVGLCIVQRPAHATRLTALPLALPTFAHPSLRGALRTWVIFCMMAISSRSLKSCRPRNWGFFRSMTLTATGVPMGMNLALYTTP